MTDRSKVREGLPDHRIDGAHRHAEAHAVVDRVAGIRKQLLAEYGFEKFMLSADRDNFLAGYDYAMKCAHPELIKENEQLHHRLMDIELEATHGIKPDKWP